MGACMAFLRTQLFMFETRVLARQSFQHLAGYYQYTRRMLLLVLRAMGVDNTLVDRARALGQTVGGKLGQTLGGNT